MIESHSGPAPALAHLQRSEAESIHILREVVAEADRPVMLYSVGKDSAVMLPEGEFVEIPVDLPDLLIRGKGNTEKILALVAEVSGAAQAG